MRECKWTQHRTESAHFSFNNCYHCGETVTSRVCFHTFRNSPYIVERRMYKRNTSGSCNIHLCLPRVDVIMCFIAAKNVNISLRHRKMFSHSRLSDHMKMLFDFALCSSFRAFNVANEQVEFT